MNYISFLLSCFLLSTSLTYAQEEKIWSLKDCIDYAIEHNIQVQQLELSIEDASLNRKDAFGNLLPNLNAEISNNWNSGLSPAGNGVLAQLDTRQSNYGVRSTIPIFNAFRNYKIYERSKIQEIANQYGVESLKDDIRLNIANTYVQILLNKENIAVLKSQNELTQQQIEQANIQIEAGVLPKGDVLLLEAQSLQELQQIVNAENTLSLSKLSLKQLLNFEVNKSIEIQEVDAVLLNDGLLNLSKEEFLNKALNIRNEVLQAQENLKVVDENVKIAKAGYYPSLNGSFSYGTSEIEAETNGVSIPSESFGDQLRDRTNLRYGLSLSIPIFNGLQARNAVDRAKINKMRTQYDLDLVKQRLTQQVYQAYLDAKAGRKSYEAAEAANNAQKTAFEYAENRFKAGVSNSFEFNQVKLRLQNSEIDLVTAKYDYLFRLKLLELYYTGKITEQ